MKVDDLIHRAIVAKVLKLLLRLISENKPLSEFPVKLLKLSRVCHLSSVWDLSGSELE